MDLRTKSVQLKIIHKAFWTPRMVFRMGVGRTHSGNGNKGEQDGKRGWRSVAMRYRQ